MSLHQFFLDEQVLEPLAAQGDPFELLLSAEDAKHARVLRLAPGEHVSVVDAAQDYFELEVLSFDGGNPTCRVAQRLGKPAARPGIVLVQGMAKGEKMDTVLRQATEIGISEFVPLEAKRSVVKLDEKKAAKRLARWRQIAKSAAMQSGRITLPVVHKPLSLARFVELVGSDDVVLLFWEEASLDQTVRRAFSRINADAALPPASKVFVVVGPEGGIDSSEANYIEDSCSSVFTLTLGNTILRTETAGVVAPALVKAELDAR